MVLSIWLFYKQDLNNYTRNHRQLVNIQFNPKRRLELQEIAKKDEEAEKAKSTQSFMIRREAGMEPIVVIHICIFILTYLWFISYHEVSIIKTQPMY